MFDSTVILNLTSLFISNGKWHHLELKFHSGKLHLSADYQQYAVNYIFSKRTNSIVLKNIGGDGEDAFIGCLKGIVAYTVFKIRESNH